MVVQGRRPHQMKVKKKKRRLLQKCPYRLPPLFGRGNLHKKDRGEEGWQRNKGPLI